MKKFSVFYTEQSRMRVRTIKAKTAKDAWNIALDWARGANYNVKYLEIEEL